MTAVHKSERQAVHGTGRHQMSHSDPQKTRLSRRDHATKKASAGRLDHGCPSADASAAVLENDTPTRTPRAHDGNEDSERFANRPTWPS
jgi:hypothetical protein